MASVAPAATLVDGSANGKRKSVVIRRGRSVSRLDKLQDFMGRSRSAQLPIIRFAFTHHALRRVWWLVLLVQIMNAVQLVGFSYMYLAYLIWPTDSLLGYLATSLLTTSYQDFLDEFALWIGLAYATLAASFLTSTAVMVFATIWRGRTEFGVTRRRSSKSTRPSIFTSAFVLACWRRLMKSRLTKDAKLRRLWLKISQFYMRFRFWGAAFGVEGKHFGRALLVREAIELLLQTTQAYQISRRVSRPYANYAITIIIGLNALVHPISTRFFSTSKAQRRFAIIFVDFFLDFIWGCVLPLWMYWPYFQADRRVELVEVYARQGAGSIETAQRELEQVLVLSFGGFLVSMFPFLSALHSLQDLKKLFADSRLIDSFTVAAPRRKSATIPRDIATLVNEVGIPGPHTTMLVSSGRRLPKKTVILQWLLTTAGLTTVAVGIASGIMRRAVPDGDFKVWPEDCRYPLTPWLNMDIACSAWMLNCAKMGITGTEQELQRAFQLIDAQSLVFLDFQNCSNLEIPASFSTLTGLRGLFTEDTHIESWSTRATLSKHTFPVLQYVGFEHTTFASSLIDSFWGLEGQSGLDTLYILEGTNASAVLRANSAVWTRVLNFECSACGLNELPEALVRNSRLLDLAFENMGFVEFPAFPAAYQSPERALWPHLNFFSVLGNHELRNLPAEVWRLATTGSLRQIVIESTSISTIPLDTIPPQLTVFAYNTTLCNTTSTRNTRAALVCTPYTWP